MMWSRAKKYLSGFRLTELGEGNPQQAGVSADGSEVSCRLPSTKITGEKTLHHHLLE